MVDGSNPLKVPRFVSTISMLEGFELSGKRPNPHFGLSSHFNIHVIQPKHDVQSDVEPSLFIHLDAMHTNDPVQYIAHIDTEIRFCHAYLIHSVLLKNSDLGHMRHIHLRLEGKTFFRSKLSNTKETMRIAIPHKRVL